MMFFSFWGMFGYMNKYMFRPVYFVYLGYLIAGASGFIAFAYSWLKIRLQGASPVSSPVSWFGLQSKENCVNLAAWSAIIMAVVLNLISMIWASTTNLGGPQGRYMFTSELPVVTLLVFGLNQLGKKYGGQLVISFLIFNAITCIGCWVWLYRLYGFHAHPL